MGRLLSCHMTQAGGLGGSVGHMTTPATHVGGHGQDGHALKDGLPGADVLGLLGHHAAELRGDLPGVHADLKQVVDQRQDRSQGEGGHEQGDEAELDHWSGAQDGWREVQNKTSKSSRL